MGEGAIDAYHINTSNPQYLIYTDDDGKRKISSNVGGEYTTLKEHLDKLSNYITSSNAPYGIHRPRNKNAFTSKKIIGPSMFDSPTFAYDSNSFFVGMSYNVITPQTTKFSLMYLLGILNSKYAKYWFWKNAKHRGVGVDVGVTKLREFPLVKNPVHQIVKDIELNVNLIIEKLQCDIDNDIFEQTTIIDKLVYHLYGLTYDEVLIVDSNTPITKEEYESTK